MLDSCGTIVNVNKMSNIREIKVISSISPLKDRKCSEERLSCLAHSIMGSLTHPTTIRITAHVRLGDENGINFTTPEFQFPIYIDLEANIRYIVKRMKPIANFINQQENDWYSFKAEQIIDI